MSWYHDWWRSYKNNNGQDQSTRSWSNEQNIIARSTHELVPRLMEVFKKIIVARINLPDHGVIKFLWYSYLHKYNFDTSLMQIPNNTELKWWYCIQMIRSPMVMTELVLSFSCDILSITVYEIILWDKQGSLLNLVGKSPKNIDFF